MKNKPYKIGDNYNKLTIVDIFKEEVGDKGRIIKKVLCICDCGETIFGTITSLRREETVGCLYCTNQIKHGMHGTNIYLIWSSMKTRCNNKNFKFYKDYGGRGIKYCKEWEKFENFYKDMGDKPEGMSLDRIDNDKGYSKENCKWSTKIQQQSNTRRNVFISYRGKRKTMAQWARDYKLPKGVFYNRIKAGWGMQRALTTKVRRQSKCCTSAQHVRRKTK